MARNGRMHVRRSVSGTRNEIELKYKCQSGADVLDMTYIDPIELLVNIGDWWCTLHMYVSVVSYLPIVCDSISVNLYKQ